MPHRKYAPPPVMTPVRSSPVRTIASAPLHERYEAAQTNAQAFDAVLSDIRALERKIERADARATRWGKLGWLGGWARGKASHWSEEALRLYMEQVTLETKAEQAREGTLFDVGDEGSATWQELKSAFSRLARVEKIWDVTSQGGAEHVKSSAGTTIERKQVRFGVASLATLRPDVEALHFSNANGPDLWMYPGVLAVGGPREAPTLVDMATVTGGFITKRFVEDERPPSDAEAAGFTWAYVNKDGRPDRRFSHNPQLPVFLYGQFSLETSSGLNERYMASDQHVAVDFARALREHLLTFGDG